MATRRIRLDYKAIEDSKPKNYVVEMGADVFRWNVWLIGPEGTPYEGGYFRAEIVFPYDFPLKPMEFLLKTPIYHPDFTTEGHVCLDLLKGKWTPTLTTAGIIDVILNLIAEPNLSTALRTDVATEFKDDKAKFEETARALTQKYASEAPPVQLPSS